MGEIYEVRLGDGLRFLDTHTSCFMKFWHNNLRRCRVGVTEEEFMKYAVVVDPSNVIYVPSFIKIG
jgi:hypothetical protein